MNKGPKATTVSIPEALSSVFDGTFFGLVNVLPDIEEVDPRLGEALLEAVIVAGNYQDVPSMEN